MYTITIKLHSLEKDPELRKKQQEEFIQHDVDFPERVESVQLCEGKIVKYKHVDEGVVVELLGK